ncbi:MAG: XTP/dITP diphosphatase [Chloroflexi bacterium]|nr:XTP/dITP diphosphatase [Chloroflexota bacterium]
MTRGVKTKQPRLLLATGNPGKARELRDLLQGIPFELVTLADVGIHDEVEEQGATFEENAVAKAKTYARLSGLCALADDSGLEVDALGGAPGPRSRRYAGEGASDTDRVQLLLKQLGAVPLERRTANFRSVIAIASPDGRVYTVQGSCKGRITFEPRGSGGFGYDPIFYIPELGKTMAGLTLEEKNRISHRGAAARAAVPLLKALEKELSRG